MTSIYVGGDRLDFKWLGLSPEQAPTLVFLHEGLGCVEMWGDFPEQVVAATGYGAFIYSRVGYGKSDPARLPRTTEFMHHEALNVLPELLKALQIRNAILFGHSDGGSIALIHAGSSNADTVRALILEAPHVFVEGISLKSIGKAKENFENGSLKASLQHYHGGNTEGAFRGWNDVWLNPEFQSWNIEAVLPAIHVPILVIQGENDQYGTLRQVEAIKEGCRVPVHTSILKHCGHSPHKDQPDAVLQSVSRFLNQVINIERRSWE